jgi:WW domain-containing oxidoreductase
VSGYIYIFASKNIDFLKSNPYKPLIAYAESKLANILHAVELQRRYGDQGIKAYSLHPGVIGSTELSRDKRWIQGVLKAFLAIISKTITQGAMTTLYCALSDEAQPGKFHSDCRVVQLSSTADNLDKTQELWELSEEILNEKTKYL